MGQRCDELVFDAHRALRFDARIALGFEQVLPRSAVSLQRLSTPAIRQIARDFGKSLQLPGLIAQCGDDHVSPETRAVLANAPALVLEAPMLCSRLELILRPAAANGIRWIK